uniref:(northern house mosquito) hypothetical protein n=1 Tax=Culex pipiens TaxID=7175 RepID=A0A8D8BKF9_CULPI
MHMRSCDALSLTGQTRGVGRAMRLGWVCNETKREKTMEYVRTIRPPTGQIQSLFARLAKTRTRITTRIRLTSSDNSRRRRICPDRMLPLARGSPLAPWRLSAAADHDHFRWAAVTGCGQRRI